MTDSGRRRRRSVAVPLGITALMATMLTGCSGDDEPEYAGICVDPRTQQRLDDDRCDPNDNREYHSGDNGFFWFYMATHGNGNVPPVGGRYAASDGTYNVSSIRNGDNPVRYVRGGVSKAGGKMSTVSRGGFGGGKVSGG